MTHQPWDNQRQGFGQTGGSYRGVGPRGYRRSDDRIREDVGERLTDDPHIDASAIEVTVSQGEVTLSGTVDRRAAKRRAEDVVEAVPGVTHVQNNLRVERGVDTGGWTGSVTGPGAPAQAGVVGALESSSMVLGKTPLPAEAGTRTQQAERVGTGRK